MAESSLPSIVSRAEAKRFGLKKYFTGKPCKHGHICERKTVNGSCEICAARISKANYDANVEKRRADAREKMRAQKAADPEGVAMRKHAYYVANADHARHYARQRRLSDPEKAKERNRLSYQRNAQRARAYARQYYWSNTERCRLAGREYYARGREALQKKSRDKMARLRCERPAHLREIAQRWREKHREIIKERNRRWYRNNRDKHRFYVDRRRARKQAASGYYSKDDVQSLFLKQNGKCANLACRTVIIQRGRAGRRAFHVDHILPLVLGGTNWPDNLQLLCAKCNLTKRAMHPLDWARRNGTLF